jgi:hypothetical protein
LGGKSNSFGFGGLTVAHPLKCPELVQPATYPGNLVVGELAAVELFFQIPDNRFGSGAHIEPLKYFFNVTMHRPGTDAQGLRDFLVHTTLA